jgi:hypothetical protein
VAELWEYPTGMGVWFTYCSVDADCPLFDVAGPFNRTQTCNDFGMLRDGHKVRYS